MARLYCPGVAASGLTAALKTEAKWELIYGDIGYGNARDGAFFGMFHRAFPTVTTMAVPMCCCDGFMRQWEWTGRSGGGKPAAPKITETLPLNIFGCGGLAAAES